MPDRELLRRLRRDLWQPPRPHGDIDRERSVGPLELFYDLVIVVLVAQAAHQLSAVVGARGASAAGVSTRGVLDFLAVFGVVWIAWFNGTFLHELHGREDIRSRNTFLVQILLLVPLGAFIPGASGAHGRGFAITAALLFALIALLWWLISRTDTEDYSRPTHLYISSTCGYAILLGASALVTGQARVAVWAVASVLYLLGIAAAFSVVPGDLADTLAITESLIERFGLLVIIVLGETVTGVVTGLTGDPADAHHIAVGIACVLVGFGSWWTYFDFIGHRAPRNSLGSTVTWLVAHFPVSAAIAAMGASMPELVERATDARTAAAPTWVMCGGAATVLLFTIVLMASLTDWNGAKAMVLRPLAVANVLAAGAALLVGVLRPGPLVLVLLLVACFSAPWTFAVLRRAMAEPG